MDATTLQLPLAFAPVDWAIVGLYLASVLGLGWWFSRSKGEQADDAFTASRSMPAWTITLSLLATSLSAATFIGAPNDAYRGNLSFLVLYLGNFLGIALVAFLFVPRLYSAGTTTIYGYLATRFGPGSDKAAAVVFLLGRFLASGSRLFIASIPLLYLLAPQLDASDPSWRISLVGCVLLIGTVGTVYTMLGGVRAVMWTDSIQLFLILGAVIVTIVVAASQIDGGITQAFSDARAAGKLAWLDFSLDLSQPYTFWTSLIGNAIFFAAVFGTDYDLAQRFLTAKSKKAAVWSTLASQGVGLITVGLFMVVGILLWSFYQTREAPAVASGLSVYVVFMVDHLPPVLSGLAVAGLFAAAQSSMDSAANAMAGVIRSDLMPRGSKLPPMLVTLFAGAGLIVFGVGAALTFDPANRTLLDFALGVLAYAVCPLMGVFLCAFLTRRGTPASVIAALLVGIALVAAGRYVPWFAGIHWFWHVPMVVLASFGVCALPRTTYAHEAAAPEAGFEVIRSGHDPVV